MGASIMVSNTNQLKDKLYKTLEYLKEENFAAYIAALEALGIEVGNLLGVKSIKELATKPLESFKPIDLDVNDPVHTLFNNEELTKALNNSALFASSWSTKKDPNNANNPTDNRGHEAKQALNKSTRRAVMLGMLVVKSLLDQELNQKGISQSNIYQPTENDLTNDDKIVTAIKNHETARQKRVRYVGLFLTVVTSVAFGLIETGVAAFFLGVGAYTALFAAPTFLAFIGIAAGAFALGTIATYVNYKIFKDDVPALLKEIAGKDHFLQGFLQYGKTPLTSKQKAALGIFSVLFALPTGIAIGALGYTSTLGVPAILGIFGVTTASAVFPPLGVAIASLVAITMTVFILRNFYTFITKHQGNFKSFISEPFKNIDEVISKKYPSEENAYAHKVAKVVSYALTGIICALAITGLAVAALSGVNSVTKLVGDVFKSSAPISAAIGIAVGGIASFTSRIFFTFAKCAGAAVNLLKLKFNQVEAEGKQVNKSGLVLSALETAATGVFYFDSIVRPQASISLIPLPHTPHAASIGVACTTVRDGGMAVNSMFEDGIKPKDKDACNARFAKIHDEKGKLANSVELLKNHSIFKFTTNNQQECESLRAPSPSLSSSSTT